MVRNLVKYILFLALIIGFVASPVSAFAAETKANDYYVGLGDSLAAGQTPTGTIDKGYTDYIAEKFQQSGVLKIFVKDYAKSGYTTQNVLDDIVNNVKFGDNANIDTVLSQASHVTLDAGANDLLHQVKVDPSTLNVTMDQAKVQEAFTQVQQNLTKTIVAIKTLNPNVKMYVMGYYNPFPHLPAEYQTTFATVLGTLNTIIQQVAVNTGATYVATDKTINSNSNFLPNPTDVHLSDDGYKAVAELFWNKMKPESPKPTPVVYWEGMVLKKGQVGKVTVEKPINLWKRVNNKLEVVRVLKPGQTYRVYGFDGKFGGQYSLGGGMFITKVNGYIQYKTPSKAKLMLVNN